MLILLLHISDVPLSEYLTNRYEADVSNNNGTDFAYCMSSEYLEVLTTDLVSLDCSKDRSITQNAQALRSHLKRV